MNATELFVTAFAVGLIAFIVVGFLWGLWLWVSVISGFITRR